MINDLAGGASQNHFLAIPEGATYSVTFTGDKGADATPANIGPTTLDCLTPTVPGATVQWECGAANATVTLTKTGQESVTATILKDGVPVLSSQTVPGAYQVPITEADEDSTVVITVTFSDAGAGTDKTLNVPVDCDHPDPKVGTPECASGGFGVVLDNEGGEDEATFVVNGTNVVVPAGGSVTHPIAAAEGATVHITVTSGGATFLDADFTRECEAAVASLSVECAEGGLLINIRNDGELPGLFTVGEPPSSSTQARTSTSPSRSVMASSASWCPVRASPVRSPGSVTARPTRPTRWISRASATRTLRGSSTRWTMGSAAPRRPARRRPSSTPSTSVGTRSVTPNVLELEQLDMPGSARILWPGAEVDAETGKASDWPGWILEDDGELGPG